MTPLWLLTRGEEHEKHETASTTGLEANQDQVRL